MISFSQIHNKMQNRLQFKQLSLLVPDDKLFPKPPENMQATQQYIGKRQQDHLFETIVSRSKQQGEITITPNLGIVVPASSLFRAVSTVAEKDPSVVDDLIFTLDHVDSVTFGSKHSLGNDQKLVGKNPDTALDPEFVTANTRLMRLDPQVLRKLPEADQKAAAEASHRYIQSRLKVPASINRAMEMKSSAFEIAKVSINPELAIAQDLPVLSPEVIIKKVKQGEIPVKHENEPEHPVATLEEITFSRDYRQHDVTELVPYNSTNKNLFTGLLWSTNRDGKADRIKEIRTQKRVKYNESESNQLNNNPNGRSQSVVPEITVSSIKTVLPKTALDNGLVIPWSADLSVQNEGQKIDSGGLPLFDDTFIKDYTLAEKGIYADTSTEEKLDRLASHELPASTHNGKGRNAYTNAVIPKGSVHFGPTQFKKLCLQHPDLLSELT